MSCGELVGKYIVGVWLSDCKRFISFFHPDGVVSFSAEGDCCSHSWIEHLQGYAQLVGHTVTRVEAVPGPGPSPQDQEGHECLTIYWWKIHTDGGYALLDFRNSSNGYYGGSLETTTLDHHVYEGGLVHDDF